MCILFVKIIQVASHIHCHRVETQLQLIHITSYNNKYHLFPPYLSKHRRQLCTQSQVHNCTTEISQYLAATGGKGVAYFGRGISDFYQYCIGHDSVQCVCSLFLHGRMNKYLCLFFLILHESGDHCYRRPTK